MSSHTPPPRLLQEEVQDKLARFRKKDTTHLLMKQKKLMTAAKMDKLAMIKNAGYDILPQDANSIDRERNTPLYYAVANGNLTFVRWLISKQADINFACSNRDTPVHIAFKTNNLEVTNLHHPFTSLHAFLIHNLPDSP